MRNFLAAFTVLLCASYTYAAPPSEQCASCHQEQVDDWKKSDHFHAMEKATVETSLGQFDGRSIDYLGQPATFSQDEQKNLWVDFTDEQGKKQHLQVINTFGYKPLQQYLFDAGKGHQQFIPFAWDSREKSEGGQRWFILHPDQTPTDVFHWTNKGQNWNQMCADCHSTDFEKNYDVTTDAYDSQFSALNVSCNACHGDDSQHIQWANGDKNIPNKGYDVNIKMQTPLFYKNDEGQMTPAAPLVESRQVETCASCHARRAQLDDRNSPQDLVNAFQPSLLTADLYYPDGQIADEVYVWGSFMQSKMHEKGVTCSNCHNPHSGKLKLPGNQTCTQCHTATEYDTDAHTKHAQMPEGNQCVDCHMPATTYMQVDPRRDHSFKVPRPDLTISTGSPNACNACHEDKDAQWSMERLKSWYPNSHYQGDDGFAVAFYQADNGLLRQSESLSRIAQDVNYSDIVRASALSKMAALPDANAVVAITRAVKSSNALQKMGAIDAVANFPIQQRWRMLHSLLTDADKSVRIETARVLAPILAEAPLTSGITDEDRILLNQVIEEYRQAQAYQADRGFSYVALGNLDLNIQKTEQAIENFKRSIKVEPIFVPAYVNLADAYRTQNQELKAQQTLEQGLKVAPTNASLQYAMAMSYVRDKKKDQALTYMAEAVQNAPSNMRYHYTYALLLKDMGQPQKSVESLEKAFELAPDNPDLAYAITQAYAEMQNYSKALEYAYQLEKLLPNNPQVAQFIEQLKSAQ